MSAILQASKSYTEPVTLPVCCRRDQSYWVLIVILDVVFVTPLIYLASSGTGASVGLSLADFRLLLAGFSVIILAPFQLYGLWLSRATIIADEDGLRWRGMGRWQVAAWHEVTDYYQKPLLDTHALNVIECGSRRLIFSGGSWNKKSCLWLQNAVAVYATNARPAEWQVLGTRPELDWTRTFCYDTRENRWIVHVVSIGLTLITVFLFFPWHLSYSTVWWKAISLTSVLGSVSWLGFKMWVIWKVKQAAHRHFDEQITVTPEGIYWQKQDVSVSATWDEVTDYYIVSSEKGLIPHIVTPAGNIDFYPAIQDFDFLKQIIVQGATQVKTKSWRTLKYAATLGDAAAKWSSGCKGIGDRIYHYRTRSNRLFLRIPTVLILILLLLFMFMKMGLSTTDFVAASMVTAIPIILVSWGWYCYRIASVRTNEEGITQYTPFGKKYIAWNDVVRFSMSVGSSQRYDEGSMYGNIVDPNVRIRFWIGIADVEELKEEIIRRAVHATGNWQGQEMKDETDIRAISGYRK